MKHAETTKRSIAGAAAMVALLTLPAAGHGGDRAAVHPRLVVSLSGCTLRLQTAPGRAVVFPVGVGRLTDGGQEGPLGALFTGPNPRDRDLYIPRRRLPAPSWRLFYPLLCNTPCCCSTGAELILYNSWKQGTC